VKIQGNKMETLQSIKVGSPSQIAAFKNASADADDDDNE
jgi:hypothetical protein